MKENENDLLEVGLWLEIPRQLVEAAGLIWRGIEDWTWDWHTNVGYLIGYTPEERAKLIDTAMEKFREIFGEYPQTVGCWMLDAFSLEYMEKKYHICAACICRDQWGTDGMSLWGGYDSIYYPSSKNMLCPGASQSSQINLPVIRMLVNDPMYNYDMDLTRSKLPELKGAPFFTLEPVYPDSGGSEEWVNWIFGCLTDNATQPYSYAQIGQENGFGWERTKKGIEYQCAFVRRLTDAGQLTPQKVSETGRWFRNTYEETPANTVAALEDWSGNGRRSVWYYSKNYRINLFYDGECFRIRDFRQFNDQIPEMYLTDTCKQHGCQYSNPPILDGLQWSDDDMRAGIYPVTLNNDKYTPAQSKSFTVESGDGRLFASVKTENKFTVECLEDRVIFNLPDSEALKMCLGHKCRPEMKIEEKVLSVFSRGDAITEATCDSWALAAHSGMTAKIEIIKGKAIIDKEDGTPVFLPDDGKIIIKL